MYQYSDCSVFAGAFRSMISWQTASDDLQLPQEAVADNKFNSRFGSYAWTKSPADNDFHSSFGPWTKSQLIMIFNSKVYAYNSRVAHHYLPLNVCRKFTQDMLK